MAVLAGVTPSLEPLRGDAAVDLPTVSVVIPMKNEERSIGACLEAILAQDYPSHLMEILVVDGGSTDRSIPIVTSHGAIHPQVRVLRNPAGSIPAGLNVGIRASRGAIIARVDARTILAPDYLSTGVRLLRETGAENVGGPVRSVAREYMGRALALAVESRFGMAGAASRYRESDRREVDTVYLGLYPRGILEAIGLYDEELLRDQDDELNYRLRARGGRILMSPALRTSYLNSPSVGRFVKQNFLYGYWKVRVFQRHPTLMNWRHFIPPLFVLGTLAAASLAPLERGAMIAALGAGSVYAAGATCAAVASGRRAGWRYVPMLPIAFALLHFSWGLGFLMGLARFFPRWFRAERLPPSLGDSARSGSGT